MIRDLLFSSAGAGGGWTPAELFKNGELGLWIDASDYSTLFTGINGTGAITGPNQRVASLRDKSPANLLISQFDSAAQPRTWDISGKRYIQFDGVDDNYNIAIQAFTGNDGLTGCLGMNIQSYNSPVDYFSYNDNLNIKSDSSTRLVATVLGQNVVSSVTMVRPRTIVALAYGAKTTVNATIALDGVTTVGNSISLSPTTSGANIPYPSGTSTILNLSQMVLVNRQLTTLEKQQLIDYVTLKS